MKNQFLITLLVLFNSYEVYKAINVSAYYETLCPFSKKFVTQQLHKAHKFFGDGISIDLIPFGNVVDYTDENGVLNYRCQHGTEECTGNKIQACVINDNWKSAKGRNASMDFFYCMLTDPNLAFGAEKSGERCSNQHFPGQWSKIWNCTNSDCGRDIYRNMARKTRELHPFPSYMPWITINNVYDEYMQSQAENDLVNFICSKANPRPVQCGTDDTSNTDGQ